MNGSENPNTTTGSQGIDEVREQLETLRVLLSVTLLMLIGLSLCADYFFTKQIRMMNGESQQLEAVVGSFPQAAANDFVKRLQDYAKTHADFATITAKYPAVFGQATPAMTPPTKKK